MASEIYPVIDLPTVFRVVLLFVTIRVLSSRLVCDYRFAGHHHDHGGQQRLPGRLCAHAGHSDMLRGAGERQVSQPVHAMLRGTASAAGQWHDGRRSIQQGGPDHAGSSV